MAGFGCLWCSCHFGRSGFARVEVWSNFFFFFFFLWAVGTREIEEEAEGGSLEGKIYVTQRRGKKGRGDSDEASPLSSASVRRGGWRERRACLLQSFHHLESVLTKE